MNESWNEAVVAEAEQVVRIARVLREVDWPGYRDTDDLLRPPPFDVER